MTEAADIAWNMIRRAGAVPEVRSMDQAREWVKAQWPDWSDWIGHQQLDNISESILIRKFDEDARRAQRREVNQMRRQK